MPNDTTPAATDAEKKHTSLLDQVTALLKNPDVQKGITELTGGLKGPSPEVQKILDDLKAKNADRLKKIKELEDQIKANEGKIAANNELLQKSRDAVAKLGEERKRLDNEVAAIDTKIAALKKQLQDDDAAIAAAKAKVAADDDEIAKLKKEAGFE